MNTVDVSFKIPRFFMNSHNVSLKVLNLFHIHMSPLWFFSPPWTLFMCELMFCHKSHKSHIGNLVIYQYFCVGIQLNTSVLHDPYWCVSGGNEIEIIFISVFALHEQCWHVILGFHKVWYFCHNITFMTFLVSMNTLQMNFLIW